MSISKILKYAKLKSGLSADELKLADLLVAITESDRLAIIELWGMKPTKSTKPATRRVIEKCGATYLDDSVCGLIRRAAIHKPDSTAAEAHEFFQSPQSSSKSKRASGIATTLNNRPRKPPQPEMCVACGEDINHANHDVANGGHEFTTDLAGRVNEVLDGATQPDPENEERCTASREGGRICNLLLDHNVHQMTTAMGYHEFVGSETVVGVGGD